MGANFLSLWQVIITNSYLQLNNRYTIHKLYNPLQYQLEFDQLMFNTYLVLGIIIILRRSFKFLDNLIINLCIFMLEIFKKT